MSNMEDTRTRSQLEERIAVLQQVCAEAYQLAGAVGAPERALDKPRGGSRRQADPARHVPAGVRSGLRRTGRGRNGPRQQTRDSDLSSPITGIVGA